MALTVVGFDPFFIFVMPLFFVRLFTSKLSHTYLHDPEGAFFFFRICFKYTLVPVTYVGNKTPTFTTPKCELYGSIKPVVVVVVMVVFRWLWLMLWWRWQRRRRKRLRHT